MAPAPRTGVNSIWPVETLTSPSRQKKYMNLLLSPVLGNIVYIGGGSLGLIILIVIIVLVVRR